MTTNNPLKKHFRHPEVYVRLPSNGRFYSKDSLEMPENGELPVYPMTAMDKITVRTPDALFNGDATVKVIQSCIPAIKDATGLPTSDLAALLIAIRIASNGHMLDISTTCPKCKHEDEFQLDLRVVLDGVKIGDYGKPLFLDDMEIYFRPVSYKHASASAIQQFAHQRSLKQIESMGSSMTDEEKLVRIHEAIKVLSEMSVESLSESISHIVVDDTTVTDRAHIGEFIENASASDYDAIRAYALALREVSELDNLKITCSECEHKYEMPLDLDTSSFFD